MDQRRYTTISSQLEETGGDPERVRAWAREQEDRASRWLARAAVELRQALDQANFDRAEEVGRQLFWVEAALADDPDDELAEHVLINQMLPQLIAGIGAAVNHENQKASERLSALTVGLTPPSILWGAWIWLARASAGAGQPQPALEAATNALRISSTLDDGCQIISANVFAECSIAAGKPAGALEVLDGVGDALEGRCDPSQVLACRLLRAQAHHAMGDAGAAGEAARAATELDHTRSEPPLFLAKLALMGGDLREAEVLLQAQAARGTSTPELLYELDLIAFVRENAIPREILAAFVELRDALPDPAAIERLRQLVSAWPEFFHLRELLGWKLIGAGLDQEAKGHFHRLAGVEIGEQLTASTALALGCLADREHGSRPAGGRAFEASRGASRASWADGLDALAEDLDQLDQALGSVVDDPLDADLQGLDAELQGLDTELAAFDEVLEGSDGEPRGVADELDPLGGGPDRLLVRSDAEAKHAVSRKVSMLKPGVRPPPVPRAKTTFTGDLQLFSLPDLIEFLRSSRRSGTLVLTSERGSAAVSLREGKISGAAVPSGSTIGDLLLETQACSAEALRVAQEEQERRGDGALLGEILIQQGALTAGDRAKAVKEQIYRALVELVDWSRGSFAFEPDRGQQQPTDVEVDAQGALLEAFRRLDEQSR